MKRLYILSLVALLSVMTGFAAEKTLTWSVTGVSKEVKQRPVSVTLVSADNAANGTWTAVSTGRPSAAMTTNNIARLGPTTSTNGSTFSGVLSYDATQIPETAVIKSISVTAATNGEYTMTAIVGNNDLGTSVTFNASTQTTKTLTGEVTGNTPQISLSCTGTAKHIDISKITVTYEEAEPEVEATTTIEVHEIKNASEVDKWVSVTADEYTTDNTVDKVRLTFAPATEGKTASISVNGEDVEFTVTAENQGVFVYTYPESTEILSDDIIVLSEYYPERTLELLATDTSSAEMLAAAATTVKATAGGLEIGVSQPARASVYDASGRLVSSVTVSGEARVALTRGLYIAVVNGKAFKAVVR